MSNFTRTFDSPIHLKGLLKLESSRLEYNSTYNYAEHYPYWKRRHLIPHNNDIQTKFPKIYKIAPRRVKSFVGADKTCHCVHLYWSFQSRGATRPSIIYDLLHIIKSFFPQIIIDWNNLPNDIIESDPYDHFISSFSWLRQTFGAGPKHNYFIASEFLIA